MAVIIIVVTILTSCAIKITSMNYPLKIAGLFILIDTSNVDSIFPSSLAFGGHPEFQ
jgi:hypothetical protein